MDNNIEYYQKENIIKDCLGPIGNIITCSKGQYRYSHPKNLIVFNANIYSPSQGKLWYGDIDLTKSYDKVNLLAKILRDTLFVFPECIGFTNQRNFELEESFVYKVTPDNQIEVCSGYQLKKGIPIREKVKGITREEKQKRRDESLKRWKIDEWNQEFKLPSIRKIIWKTKNKEIGPPIVQIMIQIQKILTLNKIISQPLQPGTILIHPADFKLISKFDLKWIKYNYPYFTTYRQNTNLSWLYLDIAPEYPSIAGIPSWLKKHTFRFSTQ